jgi:hypothetical protein
MKMAIKMITEKSNPFTEGVLVSTEIRMWGGSARIKGEDLPSDLPEEIVRAVRDLLTPEGMGILKEYLRVKQATKTWLLNNSIPFPILNHAFVHKSRINDVNNYLKERKKEAMNIAEEFVKVVKDLEADYAREYPKFYDPDKYLSIDKLRKRFVYRWTFRVFTPPNSDMKELNPSIYKEEVKKFKEDINWMREATSKMFGKELIDRLEQFKAQCEDGRVMSTTVNSVHKLIERFETIFNGYIDRKEFKKVVKELKEYMEGTDAEMLRVDDEFREVVRMKMSELSKIAIKETNDIELERGFEL